MKHLKNVHTGTLPYSSSHIMIAEYFTQYFKDLHARLRTPNVTGLLLIYPSNCVHVVEVGCPPAGSALPVSV